jgi:hypothetical protein
MSCGSSPWKAASSPPRPTAADTSTTPTWCATIGRPRTRYVLQRINHQHFQERAGAHGQRAARHGPPRAKHGPNSRALALVPRHDGRAVIQDDSAAGGASMICRGSPHRGARDHRGAGARGRAWPSANSGLSSPICPAAACRTPSRISTTRAAASRTLRRAVAEDNAGRAAARAGRDRFRFRARGRHRRAPQSPRPRRTHRARHAQRHQNQQRHARRRPTGRCAPSSTSTP